MKVGVEQGGFCMELTQENWEVGRADYKRTNSLAAEEELLRGAGTQWGMKEQRSSRGTGYGVHRGHTVGTVGKGIQGEIQSQAPAGRGFRSPGGGEAH